MLTRTLGPLPLPPPPSSSLQNQNPEERCISLLRSTTPALTRRHFSQILAFVLTHGLLATSSFLSTKLVDFCGCSNRDMHAARSIFRQVPHPSSFLWTSLIKGFSQNYGPHHRRHALLLFRDMLRHGTGPNHLTHPFVLKACGNLAAVSEGKQTHSHVVRTGFLSDIYAANGVLDMYLKCGFLEDAHLLYDEMPERNVVSHTLAVSGFFDAGDIVSARSIFEGVSGADLVLWSAMIAGYARNGAPEEALQLFERMQSLGMQPNSITMVSVVSACSQLGDYERGVGVHEFMVRSGMEMNNVVLTALLGMYINGDFVDEALKLFESMPSKDVVSWNSLINGYTKNGYAKEALEVFIRMRGCCMEPNRVTFLSVLPSCAQLGALEKGMEIEQMVESKGLDSDLPVVTALVDMYLKCGSMIDARRLFNGVHSKDVVVWTAMINGYAMNGRCEEAISLFQHMLTEGVRPNEVTFLALLTACSHGGLMSEGFKYFNSMIQEHLIVPRIEHYASMVDLLGRAGKIEEAKRFVDSMPIKPGISIWGSLLGACATHKNIEIGECAARLLAELEPSVDGNYVFLSNIYAAMDRWKDVENTRTEMKSHVSRKTPGCSWIELGGELREFFVGDRAHLQCPQIYGILDNLSEQSRYVENSPVYV